MADIIDTAAEIEELQRNAALSAHRVNRNAVSAERCEECDETIPEPRRAAVPGCKTCAECQGVIELRNKQRGGPVKERGMIFNAEMVRAILDGRKTQTRRIMKNQPAGDYPDTPALIRNVDGGFQWYGHYGESSIFNCPFGAVGDHIWVRETWAQLGNEDGCPIDWNDNLVKGGGPEAARIYRASCEQKEGNYGLWSIPDDAYWKPHTDDLQYDGTWCPSIHMPRWASRLTLEITGVRVERLQAITLGDICKEIGCGLYDFRPATYGFQVWEELWKSIYGEENWQANPWVWVIEFKVVPNVQDNPA